MSFVYSGYLGCSAILERGRVTRTASHSLTSGTIMCLSEAPSAQAAIQVHKEAHGLIPDSIEEVSEGR